MKHLSIATLVLFSLTTACAARADPPWTQLSLSTCGVDAFLKAHPDNDGRGIVIAILDTGVDMGVPGLIETTTGEVKVIDVQDFSKEGDLSIKRAVFNEAGDKIIHYAKDGSPELFTAPPAEQRPDGTTVWFGIFDEKAFKNSGVPDVNDNERRDDVFGVCVISADDGTDDDAVCFVDADADRDFTDEKPLKNYKLRYDTFSFAREKKEKQIQPLTCALNIFARQKKVSIHFDDGGHGTHVAGIAAGHRIMSQPGFNGVAPGAKIISLKIGDNRLAGGSTTTGSKQAAFKYAARYAREHNVTVVCNLSYGIGSKVEGHSSIDTFVNKLLRANPNLILCTSAGNDGPGLSTVGTPAAAEAAITVAALLAADTARDVLGVRIPHAQVTGFSSRGGELDKPDIATPGRTTSTVPRWNRGSDFWGGTSMASPYATGLAALLAQRLRDKHGVTPRSDWIKAALKNGADPVPGFTTLDYGAGVPKMPKAAQIIDRLATQSAGEPLMGFDVETESPLAVDGTSRAAYWRTTYFPVDEPQVFTIKPVFIPVADASARTEFAKRLLLRSDAEWCKPREEQIYFRGEQSATVRVDYDAAKLRTPGLYVSTLEGMDGDRVALRLVNTIVVPHSVSAATEYRLKLENQAVEGYKVRRHFVAVPSGAGAMHVILRAVENKPSTAIMRHIFRPDGRGLARYRLRLDTRNERFESKYTVTKELEPGIWELAVYSRKADEESWYSLEVRFDGIHADPEVITQWDSSPGSTPSGSVTLINAFDRPTTVTTSGRIEGYRKTVTKELTPDDDQAKIDITLNSEIESVRVRVDVSDEDYGKFTDCVVNVYDASGKAIVQDGLGEPYLELTFDNPDPDAESVSCKLDIRPAFSESNREDAAEFKVKIDYLYAAPIEIDVNRGDDSRFTLYPGAATKLSFTLADTPPEAPEGTATLGNILGIDRATQHPAFEIAILRGD